MPARPGRELALALTKMTLISHHGKLIPSQPLGPTLCCPKWIWVWAHNIYLQYCYWAMPWQKVTGPQYLWR